MGQAHYHYLRLRVRVHPDEGRQVAAIAPVIIRRIVGKALIHAHCPFGRPLCQPRRCPGDTEPASLCTLAERCPYGVLFAAGQRADGNRPPFATFVSRVDSRRDAMAIEITLLGRAWQLYPWLLQGLQHALQIGVGRDRERWRISAVKRVHGDGGSEEICGRDLSALPSSLLPDRLHLGSDRYQPPQRVTIDLLSPTRFIEDGRILKEDGPVPLSLLVARTLDRLAGFYGPSSGDLLRPRVRSSLETGAARVKLLDHDIRWIEVNDYSARQRRELSLGGKIGRLVYDSPASRFLPILRAAEILHVGKNPTSGCGRIRVSLGSA